MTTRRHIENVPDDLLTHLEEDLASEKDSLLAIWDMCGDSNYATEVNSNRKSVVRANILAATAANHEESNQRPALRRPLRRVSFQHYAVAASLALIVALSFVFSSDTITHRAPVGGSDIVSLELPDGSSVVLASGSVLSYSDSFGAGDRHLTLKGEAFFDVAPSEQPFLIETYNARTTVHGTRFSVRAWPNDIDAATDVRVQEGLVSVGSKRSDEWNLLISAGEEVSIANTGRLVPERNESALTNAFSWLNGGYEYKNEPIGNVLADLNRQYKSVIQAPVSVKLRPISIFNQSKSSLEDVLGDISATVGIKFRAISGGYELYED